MKAWIRLQKIAIAGGIIYGMWLGTNVEATSQDARSAFVIVTLASLGGLSLLVYDQQEKSR